MKHAINQPKRPIRKIGVSITVLAALGSLAFTTTAYAQSQFDDQIYQDSVPTAAVVGFNPGMIITDELFYNPNTMDANAIQNFLNAQGRSCVAGTAEVTETVPESPETNGKATPGSDPTANSEGSAPTPNTQTRQITIPCLKDYTQDTPDRPADDYCPGSYVGAPGESAALILAKVAQACQINPQALLVTLQKEQSLVTASGSHLKLTSYQRAMGYGCPDSAPCDEKYYGFFNQVYNAAHRFHYYKKHPKEFRHHAGKINDLLYHPAKNPDGSYKCGTKPVFIENQATAGLYNYTPYTPNEAALAAGGGLGDACSSYGNRNFYRFFTAWFGSTGSAESVRPADSIPSMRIAGNNRIDTAAAVSARAFPQGAQKVYIARADGPIDALAGGTLVDGPVLLVPVESAIPNSVRSEIERTRAVQVVALGGPGAIPDSVLADVAQGRDTARLFGQDRYSTAIAISREAYPQGAKRVYIADGVGRDREGSPDAVIGGILNDGPVFIIDPNNPESWNLVAGEVKNLNPDTVVALGGEGAVPNQALQHIAGGKAVARLAGKDRYSTAVAIASYVFPPQPGIIGVAGNSVLSDKALYIARGDNFADALVAGTLTDGPVLLMPSRTDTTPDEVHNYVANLHPNTVIALGGMGALHPDTVEATVKSVKAGLR